MKSFVFAVLFATSSFFAQAFQTNSLQYEKAEKAFADYFDHIWDTKADYFSPERSLQVLEDCDASLNELVDLLHTGDENKVKREETHKQLNQAIAVYKSVIQNSKKVEKQVVNMMMDYLWDIFEASMPE